jgi:DnaK suppressor protein
MIVSILQLMGFPVGKPVNSRAGEISRSKPSKARDEGISSKASDLAVNKKPTSASESQTQNKPARRQEVKAQPAKAKVVSKATPVVAKAKPTAKAVVKPVVKPKAKPAASPKPAVKPGAKSATVATPKPAAKKAAPAKVAAKAAALGKEPKPAPKAMAKEAKVASVKEAKPTAKVKVKDSVKATTMKAAQPEVVASKPKVTHSVAAGTLAKAAMPAKPVAVAPAATATPSVPARAGRPSSRLAQLTVPSMAQSVASTAAKASFTQTPSLPLIVPPLASAIKKDPKLANNWKLKPVEQLTDADLMAMPDDEYMNDTQMAYFRRKLSILKQDILSNAGETTEHLREDTVVVPDPADRATIEEEHALELRTRDRERKLLKKIEQSIQRIDAGDYGYCDETGEAIGVGRLLARPTANLSLEAQQRRELKQKMFGD